MERETEVRNDTASEERVVRAKLSELISKQLDSTDTTPINIHEIKNYIYYGFSDQKLRPRYWKVLLNYYPPNKFTSETFYKQSRKSYNTILSEGSNIEAFHTSMASIGVELQRNGCSEGEIAIFGRILAVFTLVNPCVGYVQGMEHLVKVIHTVLSDEEDFEDRKFIEEDTFCLFNNLISELARNFVSDSAKMNVGIKEMIGAVFEIVEEKDQAVYGALKTKKLIETNFPFRWILMLFSMEYPMEKVIWLWDKILSDSYRYEILLYCSAAAIILMRDVILKEDFEQCMAALQKPSMISPELLFDIADTMRRESGDINVAIQKKIKHLEPKTSNVEGE